MARQSDGAFCLWVVFVLLCCMSMFFSIPVSVGSIGSTAGLILDYIFPEDQIPLFAPFPEYPSLSHSDKVSEIVSITAYKDPKTLALLYPAGLMGGYRNQAMRFIGLLKHALDNDYDQLLLPTLVWSTRYANMQYSELAERLEINKDVSTWPIPFEDLFDVSHWNSYHDKGWQKHHFFDYPGFSLPKLVTGEKEMWEANPPPNSTVCWKREPDASIVSVSAIKKNHPNFTESFLPLLTQRMLYGSYGSFSSKFNFILDPIQNETIEYLVGDKLAKYPHKLDLSPSVENCTHPHVFGGKSRVPWNSFLAIGQLTRKNKKTIEQKQQADLYTKLIETVDEALVPAKPWRQLADHCVEHHLGLGEDEFIQEEEDPHARGHDHGYIALHARVEPEMLQHKCGKGMNRDLSEILDLVDLLAQDYNLGHLPEHSKNRAKQLHYESPISDELRRHLATANDTRPLKGTFVAVARDELNDSGSFKKLVNVTKKNQDVLNNRSISYDEYGAELYTVSLAAKDRKRQTNQELRASTAAAVEERRRLTTVDDDATASSSTQPSNTNTLPVFECGEGWVHHAFYKSEVRQQKLFTRALGDKRLIKRANLPDLYRKYGPLIFQGKPTFPLLPLPDNYFGDLLPSMLNFWLAVRADVFVGVKKSSWSNDVWTSRYYMGKGDRNFEYTRDEGILAIGNGGLPPPHKNC